MKKIALFLLSCAILAFGALSENVRANFVSSCESGGSSTEFCECVLGKVEKKYSQKQIDAIELKMRRGHSDLGYAEFVKNASKECDAQMKSGKSIGSLAVSEDSPECFGTLSAEELAALEALGLDPAFASGVVSALLESPEYRDVFLAECSVEFRAYFGNEQAQKSCRCAYEKLVSGGNVEKLLSLSNGGTINDSLVLEMFLPCMPRTFTAEMEKFLMDSCETVASKPVCRCIIKELKSHFTFEQLLRRTIRNPAFIQGYATGAAIRCKDE